MPERPRDRLGRPLPAGSPHAVTGPDLGAVTTDELAWRIGLRYVEQGLPFHAHEVFEQRWRTCPDGERAAWQALAQWGAALTHLARGNPVGASSVGAAAAERLACADEIPSCVDVAMVASSLARLVED